MSILQRRLSANLSFLFTEWPFLDRFAAAADFGFTCVEFLFPYDFPADEIARRLDMHGLALSVFNAPPGDWDAGERGLAALADRKADFQEGLRRALDYASALKARRLHVMAGLADPRDAVARETYLGNLDWAAGLAGERRVDLLIEPINSQDMPGYFLNDFAAAADFVGRGSVRLQFDLYHCHKINGAVLGRLETLLPITAHMQIAGVPERNEPSPQTLPLREIFALLDKQGYEGRVGCEYRPAAGTPAGLGWITALEEDLA